MAFWTQAQPAASSGLTPKGAWNANTNSPALASSVGTQGDYYIVSVAGNTNLNGITDWGVGDWAIFNGSVWQKIDNSDDKSWLFAGNTLAGTGTFGSLNNHDINFVSNGVTRGALLGAGTWRFDTNVGMGVSADPSIGLFVSKSGDSISVVRIGGDSSNSMALVVEGGTGGGMTVINSVGVSYDCTSLSSGIGFRAQPSGNGGTGFRAIAGGPNGVGGKFSATSTNGIAGDFDLSTSATGGISLRSSVVNLDANSGQFNWGSGGLTTSYSSSLVKITKTVSALNGFDHTGTLLDITSDINTTGDLINATSNSINRLKLTWDGNLTVFGQGSFAGGAGTIDDLGRVTTPEVFSSQINFNTSGRTTIGNSSGVIFGGTILDTGIQISLDADARTLFDTSSTISLDWVNRQGIDTTGAIAFDWANGNVNASNNVIIDTGFVRAQNYHSADDSPGIGTTITTGSLVGKTITVKNGLITGFA